MKRCQKCAKTKPFDEFYKWSRAKDGRQTWCKKCQSDREKWRRLNPDIAPKRAVKCILTEKECSGCPGIKPAEAFYASVNGRGGLSTRCRDCTTRHSKRRYDAKSDDEKLAAIMAYNYRMTAEDYLGMVAEQNNRCASCGREPTSRLHVDHDHACCPGERSCGRCVRGLLCQKCNTGLGMFNDDPDLLIAAAMYVESRRLVSA